MNQSTSFHQTKDNSTVKQPASTYAPFHAKHEQKQCDEIIYLIRVIHNGVACLASLFTFIAALADSQGLVSLIKRRMLTTKAVVRKSALQALESVIKYNNCQDMDKVSHLLTLHDHLFHANLTSNMVNYCFIGTGSD